MLLYLARDLWIACVNSDLGRAFNGDYCSKRNEDRRMNGKTVEPWATRRSNFKRKPASMPEIWNSIHTLVGGDSLISLAHCGPWSDYDSIHTTSAGTHISPAKHVKSTKTKWEWYWQRSNASGNPVGSEPVYATRRPRQCLHHRDDLGITGDNSTQSKEDHSEPRRRVYGSS